MQISFELSFKNFFLFKGKKKYLRKDNHFYDRKLYTCSLLLTIALGSTLEERNFYEFEKEKKYFGFFI